MFIEKKSTSELFKRVGALLILLPLSIMLIFVFSSQSVDDIFSLFLTSNSMGNFAGEKITTADYATYESSCRQRRQREVARFAAQLGENSNMNLENLFNVENCIEKQIKDVFVLSKLGEYLYLFPEKEIIEKKILEYAQDQYTMQGAVNEEDKVPLIQIYHNLLRQYPLHLQQKELSSQRLEQLFNNAIYVSKETTRYEKVENDLSLDFKMVYYNDESLRKLLQNILTVTEEEKIQEYETEKKQDAKIRPYKEMSSQLTQRVKNRKIKIETTKLRQTLKNKKWKSLKEIATATQLKVDTLNSIPLTDLNRVKVNSMNFVLINPQILQEVYRMIQSKDITNVSSKLIGPIEVIPNYTVFMQITKVKIDKSKKTDPNIVRNNKKEAKNKTPEEEQRDFSKSLGQRFFRFLVDEEAKQGSFKLEKRETRTSSSQLQSN